MPRPAPRQLWWKYMHTSGVDQGHTAAHRGFSLIELMTTVAIVAILAGVAYPQYLSYVRRSNRTDATTALIQAAQGLQRCYSQNMTFSYVGCLTPGSSPNGYYTIAATLTPPTGSALSTFVLTATPAKAPQTNDTACSSFTLNSVGAQAVTNSAGVVNTTTCWPAN